MTNTEAKAMLKGYAERIYVFQESEKELKACLDMKSSDDVDVIEFGSYNGKSLKWTIVDENNGITKLLSQDIILKMKFNEKWEDTTWEQCTLRKWLNSEFYDIFTAEEKAKIASQKIKNKDSEEYGTKGGKDTEDYIYLLSLEEAKMLPTDKMKASGSWWLRSSGGLQTYAAVVYSDGTFRKFGNYVYVKHGVRPVLNIRA